MSRHFTNQINSNKVYSHCLSDTQSHKGGLPPATVDPSGIVFAGEELSVHDDTTLVGLKIDNRMRWGPMVAKLATKARQRIGALYRIRHLLNSQNLKTMYMMFIRSIMEYNSVCWMGAAKSHLSSLDRIQHTAERMSSLQNPFKPGEMQRPCHSHSSYLMAKLVESLSTLFRN